MPKQYYVTIHVNYAIEADSKDEALEIAKDLIAESESDFYI